MPDPAAFPHVFAPATIGALELPHRIVMGSMHLAFESADDDGATLAAFYAERARGGAGLIVTGGVAVSRAGAGGRSYRFINEDDDTTALGRLVDAVHAEGATIALQLFHAGRYALEHAFGLTPVAPSALPSRFSRSTPRTLSSEEITDIVDQFARGAARAHALGFDAIEVMGSEGYLVDQFLSPLTNHRDDEWGGDPERRMRFGIEVVRAIRAALADRMPLIFRFTAADLMLNSTSLEQAATFAAALADAGVDALNAGIGWHESPVPTVQGVVPPGAWTPWVQAIKGSVGDVPLISGNRVNRVEIAERLLAAGILDFVSMARPFLADPTVIAKARDGGVANICIACNQACIDRSLADERVSCMVNPRAGRELEYPSTLAAAVSSRRRARAASTFAVVGGGPSGLEAARALAALGHGVELFEAADELGGQFRLARLVPGKAEFDMTISYFARELERLGVTVRLGRRIGDDDADLLAGYDGVVLASGVLPRRLDLPGIEQPQVIDYAHAFTADAVSDRVAIIGAGGIGVDLAHHLSHPPERRHLDAARSFRRTYGLATDRSDSGRAATDTTHGPRRHVALLCRGDRVGARLGRSTRWVALDALRRAGVETCTGVAFQAIVREGVRVQARDGSRRLLEADCVVIAAGQEPNDALKPLLDRLGVRHHAVGGARDATGLDAVRAFAEGLRAAHQLAATAAGRQRPANRAPRTDPQSRRDDGRHADLRGPCNRSA